MAAWEGKAYAYGLKYLQDVGCPVDGLTFDPNLVIRGLIVDKHLGNMLKVDRFGCGAPGEPRVVQAVKFFMRAAASLRNVPACHMLCRSQDKGLS